MCDIKMGLRANKNKEQRKRTKKNKAEMDGIA